MSSPLLFFTVLLLCSTTLVLGAVQSTNLGGANNPYPLSISAGTTYTLNYNANSQVKLTLQVQGTNGGSGYFEVTSSTTSSTSFPKGAQHAPVEWASLPYTPVVAYSWLSTDPGNAFIVNAASVTAPLSTSDYPPHRNYGWLGYTYSEKRDNVGKRSSYEGPPSPPPAPPEGSDPSPTPSPTPAPDPCYSSNYDETTNICDGSGPFPAQCGPFMWGLESGEFDCSTSEPLFYNGLDGCNGIFNPPYSCCVSTAANLPYLISDSSICTKKRQNTRVTLYVYPLQTHASSIMGSIDSSGNVLAAPQALVLA